jgi:farnesyl diphosphate synthase
MRQPSPALSVIAEPMRQTAADLDALFDAVLPLPPGPDRQLIEAMRHATIGGGKRLRPLLLCASADLFDVSRRHSLCAGLAVECVHAQSLIHDDLPCMDDDALRRGKPTVHVAFGEATAVLAGDALLALAFEILSGPETHPSAEIRAELISELARASGATGMAAGQMMDLLRPERKHDLEAIARLQRLKTGALIGWCVEAGAILGSAPPDARTSLRGYAQNLGLAFQIADDLLDRGGNPARVGKRLRKDRSQGKQSFVSLLGAREARQRAAMLAEQAVDHLRGFDARADLLRGLARFAVERDL